MNDNISLRLFDEIEREPRISQRVLADRLGIAVGLVNSYIKRLYQKGYIKLTSLPRNRLKYIITPTGFAEKARLTYDYIRLSITYYRDRRQRIERTYASMIAKGINNVLLWGDGEIAELCYISTRGLPINIVGVIDYKKDKKIENDFFGHHVFSIDDCNSIGYDAVLVTSVEDEASKNPARFNIDIDKIYYL